MNIIKVEKGLFSWCSTINKALKKAQDGDQILVKPGVYEETIVLDKSVEIYAEEDGVVLQSFQDHTVTVKAQQPIMRGIIIRQLGDDKEKETIRVQWGNALFENCDIQSKSGVGVAIYGTNTNPFFKNCQIAKNGHANVYIVEGAQGRFEKCRIFGNQKSGVVIGKQANPLFIDCEIFDTPFNGVYVSNGGLGTFQNCIIRDNGYPSILIKEGANTSFEACKISNVKDSAVYIDENGLSRFLGCEIYESGNEEEASVEIQANANPYFEKCMIRNSKNRGILCTNGGKGRFVSCEITGSQGAQVFCTKEASPVFEHCHIHSGSKFGIRVLEGGLGRFLHCNIYEHVMANVGINLQGNPYFEQCNMYNGQKEGIYVQENGLGTFKNCRIYHNQTANLRIESEKTMMQHCLEEKMATIDEVLQELNQLIGLSGVKAQLQKTIQFIQFNKEISQYGVNAQDIKLAANHTVLSGNPGTGKTTVARLLGKLYAAMGLLPSGHVVAVNREKLVGKYIGHTAPKTKECIEAAIGGILFIDEAYELANKGEKDFGGEAIAVILEEMENRRGEFIVVIAGYQEEIKEFLESNPGLKSRFNQEFTLDDYTPEEMKEIALALYKQKERNIQPEALELLFQEFTYQWRKRDRFFANARAVRNLVEASLQGQAERCMAAPRELWNNEFLTTVSYEDIQGVLPKTTKNSFLLPIQEKELAQAMAQLESMIGLQGVKQEIQKLVALVRYYREEGKDVLTLSPHTVLKGSPGTGKTEVARLIARIYEALGILERGDLVEVNRDRLVRSYAGESEKITVQYIEKAMGGVLFIDEAYQLTQYGTDDPGHKVVEVLLKYMEDRRGEFIVIVAGYSSHMDQFLASNDGLRRRFVRQLEFEDYTPDELMAISEGILEKNGYVLSLEARETLASYFWEAYQQRDRSFGNAGFARNVIMETIKNTDYRVAMIPKEQRSPGANGIICSEDIVRTQ